MQSISPMKPPSRVDSHTPKIVNSVSQKQLGGYSDTPAIVKARISMQSQLQQKPDFKLPETPFRRADPDVKSSRTRTDRESAHVHYTAMTPKPDVPSRASGEMARSQSYKIMPKGEALIQGGGRSGDRLMGLTIAAQSQRRFSGVKYGAPNREPAWKFPQDTKQTYVNHIKKAADAKPDPAKYHVARSWKINQKNFGLGPARTTFTDEAQAHSKKVPAPTSYNPKLKVKIPLGKMEQTEGVNYLSDGMYLAKKQPGPEKYEPKTDLVKPRASICKFLPSQGKKDWRPKKTKDPDPGSYEVRKSQQYVGRKEL